MLASLASSWKNLAPDQVETVAVGNGDQLEPENNRDYEYVPEEDEAAREDCKALLADDGWELFDSSEVNEWVHTGGVGLNREQNVHSRSIFL